MKHIVLTGFMGAGKTTLGKQLAAHYNLPFYDIDEDICEGEHQSIEQLISGSEDYFRSVEYAYVEQALNRNSPSIISLGGGAYCNERTYHLIRSHEVITVYLSMSDETCLNQLERIRSSRPLLNAMEGDEWKSKALNLYQVRKPLYARADLEIKRENVTVEMCAERIEERYGKIY